MTQIKTYKFSFIYIILILIIALMLQPVSVKAKPKTQTKDLDIVFKLEINSHIDYEEVKESVLLTDVNYVVFPEKLKNDVKLGEVVASDIDYSSNLIQEVDIEVHRFVESKNEKTKIDVVAQTVKIQFIDTTPPELSLKQNSVTLTEGDKFNPDNYLGEVSDNSFDKVNVDINDQVDTSKPGTYKVEYKAIDSFDNTASKSLSVNVKAKPKPKPKPQPVIGRTSVATVSVNSGAVSNDYYGALALINSHRAANGLHALKLGGSAHQSAAATRAAEASGYVSHTRPDGRSYHTAFTDLGLHHSSVIENLTYSGSTAADKVAWWMSSPGHRAALMRSDVTHIALGSSGKMWAAIVYR